MACLLAIVMTVGSAPLAGFVGLELPDWLNLSKLFEVEAEAATSSGYTYEVVDGKAIIIDCNSSLIRGDIAMPLTLGGYPVTGIGDRAFSRCIYLTSITIGKNVTIIGDEAFSDCIALTSVTIPESVTNIGARAFARSDIDINNSIYGCLSNITVNGNNQYYSSDEYGVLFNKSKTILIQYPVGNTRSSYEIPGSVTSIDECAFRRSNTLTNVIISNSVISIGESAFESCVNLSNLTLSDNLASIGYKAFYDCQNLSNIFIPESVTSIGESAFYNCDGLTNIIIPYKVSSIGREVFSNCDSLMQITVDEKNQYYSNDERGVLFNKNKTLLIQYPKANKNESYLIPNSVIDIEYRAFINCKNLLNLTIPDSVTGIGVNAFIGCDFAIISIPGMVESIGFGAFSFCQNLSKVIIDEGVTSIGKGMFQSCVSLSNIVLPESVTSIDDAAFNACGNLTSITIGKNVTTIGNNAFRNCNSLKDVYFTGTEEEWNNITVGLYNEFFENATVHFDYILEDETDLITGSCGDNIFWSLDLETGELVISGEGDMPSDWSSSSTNGTSIIHSPWASSTLIKSVVIKDGVTSVGDYSFSGCTNLLTADIPQSVTSLSAMAFDECDNLNSITVNKNNTFFSNDDYGVLYNKDKTTLIKYPTGNNRQTYTVPNSVTIIGSSSFKNNSYLVDIELPDSLLTIGRSAFYSCTSLKEIYIPSGVTLIDLAAFLDCTNLEKFIIENGAETLILSGNFGKCNLLTNIILPDGVRFSTGTNTISGHVNLLTTGYYNDESNWDGNLLYIGNHLVAAKTKDTSSNIVIRDGTVTVAAQVFSNYPNLTYLYVPSSIKIIGYNNFGTSSSFKYVCYELSEEDWNKISIGSNNNYLTNAKKFYNHTHYEGKQTVIKGRSSATCDLSGYTGDVYCRECDWLLEKGEFVDALGHNIIIDKSVDSTCTQTGLTEGQHCSRCDSKTIEQETIPLLKHTESVAVVENIVASKCEKAGSFDSVVYCSVCGKELSRNTITVDELEHQYDTIVTAPTCTESGYTTYTCSLCGDSFVDDEIVALKHDIIIDEAVPSTCTETGLTEGQHCSRCDEVTVKQETTPRLKHIVVVKDAVAPTCTQTGLTSGCYCENCDEITVTQEIVPELGHVGSDIVVENIVASECEKAGSYDNVVYCSVCDEEISRDTITVEALEHQYDTVVTAPTCTESGYTTYTCSLCKDSYVDDVVNAFEHDIIVDNAVLPTCTETGLTEGQHCSRCDEATISQEIVVAKGHNCLEKHDTTKHWKECACGYKEDVYNHIFNPDSVCSCGYIRVVDATVSIKNNTGSKTINYGENLKLTAIASKKPYDAKIYWYVDGMLMGEGEVFNISLESGSKIVTVKLVDANGYALKNVNGNEISDSEKVSVKADFFQKLISFFKNLFGINRTIIQSLCF